MSALTILRDRWVHSRIEALRQWAPRDGTFIPVPLADMAWLLQAYVELRALTERNVRSSVAVVGDRQFGATAMSNFPAEKQGEHEKRVAAGLDPVLDAPGAPVEAVPVPAVEQEPAKQVKRASTTEAKTEAKPAAKPAKVAAPVKRSGRK